MPVSHARVTAVTSIDDELPGLLEMLGRVPDPRRRRGRRYTLVFLLAVAVACVLAGGEELPGETMTSVSDGVVSLLVPAAALRGRRGTGLGRVECGFGRVRAAAAVLAPEGGTVFQDGVDLPLLPVRGVLHPELVLPCVAAGGAALVDRGQAGVGPAGFFVSTALVSSTSTPRWLRLPPWLPLPRLRPRHLSEVRHDGDFALGGLAKRFSTRSVRLARMILIQAYRKSRRVFQIPEIAVAALRELVLEQATPGRRPGLRGGRTTWCSAPASAAPQLGYQDPTDWMVKAYDQRK